MPIFEFKCLKCEEYMEILVMGSKNDEVEMKCGKCGSTELERILSSTQYKMAPNSGSGSKVAAKTRTCSGGSCTTWDLPGHSR